MITYPQHIQDALNELRDKGFAVVIFTPQELKGVDPTYVEGIMTQYGWDAIEQSADPTTPDFDWETEEEEYPE
jgi:hypothetical protein